MSGRRNVRTALLKLTTFRRYFLEKSDDRTDSDISTSVDLDLDLDSRSLKIKKNRYVGSWIMSNRCRKFHKDLIGS